VIISEDLFETPEEALDRRYLVSAIEPIYYRGRVHANTFREFYRRQFLEEHQTELMAEFHGTLNRYHLYPLWLGQLFTNKEATTIKHFVRKTFPDLMGVTCRQVDLEPDRPPAWPPNELLREGLFRPGGKLSQWSLDEYQEELPCYVGAVAHGFGDPLDLHPMKAVGIAMVESPQLSCFICDEELPTLSRGQFTLAVREEGGGHVCHGCGVSLAPLALKLLETL